jgi:hypothetical protein
LAYLARGDVKTARRTYAQGVERFGAAEAKGMGAADGLRRLVERGVQVASAQDLLRTFWP